MNMNGLREVYFTVDLANVDDSIERSELMSIVFIAGTSSSQHSYKNACSS